MEGHRDESALIGAAVDGDKAAFEALYRQYVRAVHRYLYRAGAGRMTEDLTAEVFLRAYRSIRSYEDRGRPFLAWLYRIATNLQIEAARKKSNQEEPSDEIDMPATSGPEALALHNEDRRALANALNSLSPRDRSVLVLRYMEGLSALETAAALGLTEANTRQIAKRALGKLHALLETEVAADHE